MKKCPYCAEEIQDEAIVCRFCGRSLTTKPLQAPAPAKDKPKSRLWLWLILAIAGVCIGAFILIFVLSLFSGGGGGGGGGTTIYATDFVQVQSDWTCSTNYGYTTFNGIIKNISNAYDLRFIQLRGTIYKADGTTVVNTEAGYIDSDIVYKGQTSTFSIMVNNPNETGTKCKIAVEDASFVK